MKFDIISVEKNRATLSVKTNWFDRLIGREDATLIARSKYGFFGTGKMVHLFHST